VSFVIDAFAIRHGAHQASLLQAGWDELEREEPRRGRCGLDPAAA